MGEVWNRQTAWHLSGAMRAIVAFALFASLSSSCKKKEAEIAPKGSSPPAHVALVTVQEASAPDVLMLTGLIAADQRSEVTADTQGKVISVLVERGQRVRMGQPVVQLDVRTATFSAREAKANLDAARAQKQLAEEECKRAQALLDKGALTRSEYDRQAAQCTSTLEQVNAAKARADMITKSVSDGLVRAPFDGQVTEKSVAPGEWVAPGKTLFTLVDDDPLRVELSVPEAVIDRIRNGQQVHVTTIAHPDRYYPATVTRIGGEIGKSRALIVEATLASHTDLVPGMFAEAYVVIGQRLQPVVPSTAVKKTGKLWHAFVVINGELQDRIVQIQAAPQPAPGQVAILQGLKSGEPIVEQVTDQTIDGLRVVQADARAKREDANRGPATGAKPEAANAKAQAAKE
jgi:membrane fusion protein (multidrug efflux system)